MISLTCWLPLTTADEPRPFTEQQLSFFETRIRPVLVAHCYECHAAGAKIVQGGLRVDSRAALLRGGDNGAAVDPGKAAHSLLLKALRYDGVEMPPKGKLPEAVIKDFEAWIEMGLPDPRQADPPRTVHNIDLQEGRKHWAFQPVRDPTTPPAKDAGWVKDPIDRSCSPNSKRKACDRRRMPIDTSGCDACVSI